MSDESSSTGSSSRHPWIGWTGDVAHPKAPVGGGGPGGFTNANTLGQDIDLFPAVPHPQSPDARYLVLNEEQKAEVLDDSKKGGSPPPPGQPQTPTPTKPNPPPATVTSKTLLKQVKNAQVDIEVYVEVVADGKSTDPSMKGALTEDDNSGLVTNFPGYSYDGKHKITKYDGPFTMKGTIQIQTTYGPNADAAQPSAYGRGTTKQDEAAGDTSLGFHESCHRKDFLQYLTTKDLPQFSPAVGISVDDYKKAKEVFSKTLQSYFDQMKKDSKQQTDEVGYTLTEYQQMGPRQKP